MSSQLQDEAAFEGTILGFFYRQWARRQKSLPAGTKLDGSTAIITGSNVGLGLEAGRQLLQLGLSRLIVAVRSMAKGDRAATELGQEFPNAQIEVWPLVMDSYESITSFVQQCEALHRIDIVILNAGLARDVFTLNEATGHEQTFQVNYLSTMLLTILLLPVLKSKRRTAARTPVLSVVGSDTAYMAHLDKQEPLLAAFDRADGYSGNAWYMRAKLLQLLFVARLAERYVNPAHVVVNVVNPGLTGGTDFGRNGAFRALWGLFVAVNGRTLQAGASIYVDAVAAQGKESHGSFVSDWALRPYPAIMYTEAGKSLQDSVWKETMDELDFAGVGRVLRQLKEETRVDVSH